MGDRANIAIEQGDGTRVWLYTHWSGHELPQMLHTALKRGKERWKDTPYLARIIFADMIDGREQDLTGFGITTTMTDNEHLVLVVDPAKTEVRIEQAADRPRSNPCLGKALSFEQYCALPEATWTALDAL